jgi:LysM repeat protein
VIPNGATWQSLANTLYGVISVEGGNALQAALGNIPLTPGAILTGLPATLSVTTSIPPYYTVRATDTWSHIAETVYGVTDVNAIAQLRTLLGNPTLSAGLQLVVPSSYNYVTSGSFSAPLDWSLVNTTTTELYNLNTSALTTPLDSWSPPPRLDNEVEDALTPRVAYDANNNGIVVWSQGSDIKMVRYSASAGTWSAPVALDSNPNGAHSPKLAMDRATGNAIVSWLQSDGTIESRYVSSFDASTNTWSTPALLEASDGLAADDAAASKAGNHAAVAWVQLDGTENNLYLSRFVGGTWTAPALIDASSEDAEQVDVAVDANGNASVIWRQYSPADGESRIYVRRWDNTAQVYGAVAAIDGDGDRQPHIAFDAQGNGFALWGGGAYARRFNVTTGQWGPQIQLHTSETGAWIGELAVDAAGNALAAWVQDDGTNPSTYGRYYDVTTQSWGPAVPLENSANPVSWDKNITVSLVDGAGVVAWMQEDDVGGNVIEANVHAARLQNGVWGPAAHLDNIWNRSYYVTSAIDADNNASVVWMQATYVFHSVSNATPYYSVPAGATWRSIAAALYNINSDAAGQALQTAMSNTPLSTGLRLQGMPATLTVNPEVPTHYIVRAGDTWASITLALYGTNATQAATALQDALQNPTLTVGDMLYIPSVLNYSVPDAP